MRDDVKYTIAVDKLEILLSNNLNELELHISTNELKELELNGFILRRNYAHVNPGFKYCYEVIFNNKAWGYYYYDNSGRYRYNDVTTSLLHISNHSLYERGFSTRLVDFINNFGLDFQKYKFLEIAVDGKGLIERYSRLAKSEKFIRRKKIKERRFFNENKERSYKLGSDRSDKHISIYCKSQEITNSNKVYIYEFWKLNGLVTTDDQTVDRVEGRFRTKALFNLTVDFAQLENPDYLASYFQEKLGDYIVFKNESNYKKKLIYWGFFGSVEIRKASITKAAISIHGLKPVIRILFEEFVATNNDIFLESLVNICDKYNMDDWFINKVNIWENKLRVGK